jgi:hypothetical protein
MSPRDLLNLFRLEVDDTAEPYFLQDPEFYNYLDEAQDLHVRLIGGIADRRSSLTKITYKIGDQFKKYDERILRIKGAFDEDNRVIAIRNLDNFETSYLEDDYGLQIRESLDDGRTGDIRYLITDVEHDEIQFYPIPDAAGWIRLYVYRRPLEDVTCDSELEIPSYYHINLLNWVKYKYHMIQDSEIFDGTKAIEFRQAFVDGVADAKNEKRSREDRKRFMRYGGIPMQ